MKILMVSNEFPPNIGGIQTHVLELSRAMVRLGHDVLVLTRKNKKASRNIEEIDGVEVIRYWLPNNHLVYDWLLHRYLKRHIEYDGYDVVHVHGMRPLAACAGLECPVVFTNHTSSFLKRVKKGWAVLEKMRGQLEIADLILTPSKELAYATKATGYLGPIKFISNGVDINKFYPAETPLKKKLGIPDEAIVFVLARRLHEKNGVLYFARALSKIKSNNLHVIVAGDGAERAEFEEVVAQSEHGDRVHMLGGVANHEMLSVFNAGDVSVLPSLMEATSIAGLEAMACGLPLIGSRVGGIPFIVEDGVNGILVEPASPEELAKAIELLCNNRGFVERMGLSSLEKVKENFSWDVIAGETIQLMSNLAPKR